MFFSFMFFFTFFFLFIGKYYLIIQILYLVAYDFDNHSDSLISTVVDLQCAQHDCVPHSLQLLDKSAPSTVQLYVHAHQHCDHMDRVQAKIIGRMTKIIIRK